MNLNTPAFIGHFNKFKFYLKMTRSKEGVQCEFRMNFWFLVLENHGKKWFMIDPCIGENFFQFQWNLRDAQPPSFLGWRGSFHWLCMSPPWGPIGCSPGRRSWNFLPFTCHHMCRIHKYSILPSNHFPKLH